MQMKQRALDCGEGPAYGPIPRDAKIWRAQKTEQEWPKIKKIKI